jgi:UDP-N-acetylmuramoyl-L-alanyl-D-glutamate--2,6-diaminopimelate ligase
MLSSLKKLVPEPIKNIYHFIQALLGALIFLFPSRKLKIIGVTGTDGKTTTTHLIHHILNKTGRKTSMLSTVEAKIGEEHIDTGLHVTTPNPFKVQYLLHKMRKAGSEFVVLETTSHGLAQSRVALVKFLVGIITNVTHEHLDYHKKYEKYLEAKIKILKGVDFRILNGDEPNFEKLKDQGSGQLISFGVNKEADFSAKKIRTEDKNLEFELTFTHKKKERMELIKSNLFGDYNAYNILAAFAATYSVGVTPEKITFLNEGQDFDCMIDFAHTPASLEAALKTLQSTQAKKIISVFGSAGERDVEKRPMMGKISTQLSDYSIFTAEDPRNEDVNIIIDQIAKGALSVGGIPNRTFWKIPDRAEAINTAIQTLAQEGDTVVVFGKGHEKSMNIKGTENPWSDEQIARNAIRVRLNK